MAGLHSLLSFISEFHRSYRIQYHHLIRLQHVISSSMWMHSTYVGYVMAKGSHHTTCATQSTIFLFCRCVRWMHKKIWRLPKCIWMLWLAYILDSLVQHLQARHQSIQNLDLLRPLLTHRKMILGIELALNIAGLWNFVKIFFSVK